MSISLIIIITTLIWIWLISLKIVYGMGLSKGWKNGHEDTKKATYEVLRKDRR